ncbi:MAG: conjugal transfer protein TraX [Clostridia bacterium]|nr:conjugal transfer protein TraX [Clostridia bacterium]
MNIFLITKLIAFITMLIDHIGFSLDCELMRIIGRVSFPLFCLLIGQGVKKTKKPNVQLLKLLIFGLISEPIFYLYFNNKNFNVMLGFFVFALIIYISNKLKLNNFSEIFLIITASLFEGLYFFEYGYILPILCYIFYKCDNKYLSILYFSITEILYALYKYALLGNFRTFFTLCAIPVIFMYYVVCDKYKKENKTIQRHIYKNKFMNILSKNIFYILYPLHLGILYLIFK